MSKIENIANSEFIAIVRANVSRGDIAKVLGYKGMSGVVSKKINERIQNVHIDVSHFIKGGEKSRKHKKLFKVCPVCTTYIF